MRSHAPEPLLPSHVAVIGAGLAGLTCARSLADHDIPVTVFEKSRGFGGRCATRREGVWRFDHGAQYFTLRDERLLPLLHAWLQQGVIARWEGTLAVRDGGAWRPASTDTDRYVALPGMSALGGHLATGLDVRCSTPVAAITGDGPMWRLTSDSGTDLGAYDVVLACIPAPQAMTLLGDIAPSLAAHTAPVVMHPTWATMLVLGERPSLPWDGAFVNDDATLGWIARDASKPARAADETWVLHATRAWTVEHLGDDAAAVAAAMTEAFAAIAGAVAPVHAVAHRWRYALPDPVAREPAWFDPAIGLGAGGDWCGGPRVEGALLSGLALARRVMTPRDDRRVMTAARPASA